MVGFTLAVTSPISIDSLGRYVCKIPYELKDGVIAEDALSETTGNYEYELVDLTSQEQFNYILAADTNLLSSQQQMLRQRQHLAREHRYSQES